MKYFHCFEGRWPHFWIIPSDLMDPGESRKAWGWRQHRGWVLRHQGALPRKPGEELPVNQSSRGQTKIRAIVCVRKPVGFG